MRNMWIALTVVPILAFSIWGKEEIAARVGKEVILVQDIEKGMRKGETKEATLNRLVEQKLFAQDAIKKGYERDIGDRLENQKKKLMVRQLYNKVVVKKARVHGYTMKHYWNHMGKQVKARHILVKEKKEAREIYLRLKRGEKFEDIAKTESIDKRSGNNGGDLGWIRWGKMEPKFQRVAFKLKKGKFSRPVKTRYGWHIIKVDDIKKVEKKPFNEERKNIERALKRQEMRKLADGFLVHLKRIANIKYNEEIVTTIAKKSSGQGRTLPAVSPEEKKKIIARASFGAVTVGDFLDMANKNWRRPSFDKPENIKNFISNSLVYEKLLPMEAERHGLDKDPNVIKGLNEVKERLLIGTYMNKEISQKVEAPSDSELIAYYNAHKKDYKEEARAKTRIITCAKRDEIEKTRKKIIRGTDFSKIAKKFSTHRTKNSGGNLGWITRGKYPEIEKKAWTIRKGRVSRPFKVKEGYAIIKVEDRKPERIKEFKEVKNKINRELLNKRKEERKKELVEELKKKIKVEIYEKEG